MGASADEYYTEYENFHPLLLCCSRFYLSNFLKNLNCIAYKQSIRKVLRAVAYEPFYTGIDNNYHKFYGFFRPLYISISMLSLL